MSDRHCGSALHAVEHEAGLAVLHAGVLEQRVHDEAAVVGHVGHDHAQQVVHFAGERGAFHHLGPGLDAGTEQVHGIALVAFGVLFQPDVQVRGEAQAHGFRPHQGDVAVDHAGIFQPLGAAQHRAGRQAHLFADDIVGFAAVVLKAAQDRPIKPVQCVGSAHGTGFYEAPRVQARPAGISPGLSGWNAAMGGE